MMVLEDTLTRWHLELERAAAAREELPRGGVASGN